MSELNYKLKIRWNVSYVLKHEILLKIKTENLINKSKVEQLYNENKLKRLYHDILEGFQFIPPQLGLINNAIAFTNGIHRALFSYRSEDEFIPILIHKENEKMMRNIIECYQVSPFDYESNKSRLIK